MSMLSMKGKPIVEYLFEAKIKQYALNRDWINEFSYMLFLFLKIQKSFCTPPYLITVGTWKKYG